MPNGTPDNGAAGHVAAGSGSAVGTLLALVSAASFGMSGALARGLMDSGWTAGAAVTARVMIAAAVLLVPALVALRGRWWLLRRNAGLLVGYGLIAVAGCQLCYFNAVDHMEVGSALLIEYTAPVLVVLWLWGRHGQRPGPRTLVGAVLAALGLVGVLDLVDGTQVSLVGMLWALGAMVGAAIYFVLSAADDTGLPPIVLAAGGLVVGAVALVVAGGVGMVPMAASTAPVTYRDVTVLWWVPLALVGLVACALAYCAGIAASRRLGPRLASFVALFEVVAALGFAWLLLAELPRPVQLLGGVLILAGVITVKSGEPRTERPAPSAAGAPPAADVPEGPDGPEGQAKSAGLNSRGSTMTSQLPELSRMTASTP
ncbi:hypothetical protein BCD49_26275 [Pseudofrankia sp. EUN1h]|nr:hypothetical protein BCD49_26275 [Pseudofrankia sp. EUN1h]